MNYKFLSQDQKIVGIVDDDGLIRVSFIAGGDDRIHEEFNNWLAEGNTPEPADPPPPPDADWRGFLDALRSSTVFAALRGQARLDVGANALATELRLALGEAALGMADPESIQVLLGELLPTLDAGQVSEIATAVETFNIPLSLE